ncbi:bifunctional ornithine acetyltransferase/N-acetylglutamate synthase, partial [Klebsiella aerogenes]|uniref:bifunctional ornithine acetyltransferase/N-acetylglutamate synthase n=1 Tax=Klebsiella aerogenes TaxID=548 RepID=UPI0019547BF6
RRTSTIALAMGSGDTSTNDTVALLANGAAGGKEVVEGTPDYGAFRAVLTDFAAKLAQLVLE